jgi:hypothetical protein
MFGALLLSRLKLSSEAAKNCILYKDGVRKHS